MTWIVTFVLFMIQELDVQLLYLPAASSLGSLLIIAEMILDFAQLMGFSDIVFLTHKGDANSDEQYVEMGVGSLSAVGSILVDRSSANNLLFTSCCPSPAM